MSLEHDAASDRSPGERYLALGDSFTIGTGTTPGRSFPAVLVDRWRARGRAVSLTVPAVNGYTTDDLIAHELPLVAHVRPTLVTLLIGANDIVRGSTLERYRAQARSIVERIRGDAPAARLFALPQPDWSRSPAASAYGDPRAVRGSIDAFNAAIRETVEGAGGAYVDLFPLMVRQADAAMLSADGLHPSARAYAEWAAALEDVL